MKDFVSIKKGDWEKYVHTAKHRHIVANKGKEKE